MTLSFSVAACRCLKRFPPNAANAGKSGSALSGEFWGGRLDGVSGTLGCPLERRAPFMLITMLVAAVGVNREDPGMLGIRPRFSARSIRQSRRVLHCSSHFASEQTMSSERGSA